MEDFLWLSLFIIYIAYGLIKDKLSEKDTYKSKHYGSRDETVDYEKISIRANGIQLRQDLYENLSKKIEESENDKE